MKKLVLFMGVVLFCVSATAQVSSAKLQWYRKQLGTASDVETPKKAYRDPSTGNIFVMYQGSFNFGVARFDNSGANTGGYKYIASGGNFSGGGDFVYAGNNQVIAAATEGSFNCAIKFDMSGNLLWKYKEPYVSYNPNYFYSYTSTAVALDQNNQVLLASSLNDSASITKLNTSGQPVWQKILHPAGYDAALYSDIVTDNFNNIVGCGMIRNSSGGDFDGFVVSYDENGNKNWEHMFTGLAGGMDSAAYVLMDNSGNSYIAGYVRDSSVSNRTIFIAKYNASGGLQYYKKFHVPGQTDARLGRIALDPLGNLLLCGTSFNSGGNGTSWIAKYSNIGTQLWTYNYNNASFSNEIAEDIESDQLGNVYMAGTVHNYTFGVADEFVIKLNSTGIYQWTQVYDNANGVEDRTYDLLVDNSGNSFVAGINASYLNYDANVTLNKFSASGLLQWEGFFDSPGNLTDNAIKIIRDGSHAVYTLSNIQNNSSDLDVAISKYNTKGTLLWQIMFDSAGVANYAWGMHMDAQKNLYVLMGATSGWDTKVIKYDSLGTRVWDRYFTDAYYTISGDAAGNIFLGGGQSGYLEPFCMLLNANGTTIGSYVPSVTGNGFNRALSSVLSPSGDFYVLSLRDNYSPNYSQLNISKFNASAGLQWTKDIHHLDSLSYGSVWPKEIGVDLNGDIYALSRGRDFTHLYLFNHLVKLDASGGLIWEQKYNNGDQSSFDPSDLELDAYGQVWTACEGRIQKINPADGSLYFEKILYNVVPGALYMAGPTLIKRYSSNELLTSCYMTISNQTAGIALTKMDSTGNYIWHQNYIPALAAGGYAVDMVYDSNGRIYMHCNSQETEGSFADVVTLKFCDVAVPAISVSSSPVNICPGSPVTIVCAAASGYQWFPNNELSQSIQADSTGNYYALAYHTDGCFQSTDTISVSLKPVPVKPDICLVTVDSLSTHNIVYWDKTSYSGAYISHFNVYREDVTNLYSYIGFTDYDSLSEFHDYDFQSNPNVTTKRYKISAVDTCGQESPMSDYHNTIYIVNNGSGQFSWNALYTIENQSNPVNNYVLMRDTNSSGNWVQIASTAGTQQNINDPSYASFPNGRWRVETVWGISCDPTRAIVNTSRSNIKNQQAGPGGVGIAENENALFSVYPNPANDVLTFNNLRGVQLIKLFDVTGREIRTEQVSGNTLSLNVSDVANGMYIIRSYNADGKLNGVKKLEILH